VCLCEGQGGKEGKSNDGKRTSMGFTIHERLLGCLRGVAGFDGVVVARQGQYYTSVEMSTRLHRAPVVFVGYRA
jgi:hypothetical protein